jgi:hypothetical protein
MAAIGIAAGKIGNRNHRARAPNKFRQGCITEEDDYAALRLARHEVHQLALEYMRW